MKVGSIPAARKKGARLVGSALKRVDPLGSYRGRLPQTPCRSVLRYAPERELQAWGDRARREALAAIALNPDLAEAHLAQAAVI